MLRPAAQAAGAGAVPPAWGLAVAGQVLFVVGGQLAGVILLPPHRQLGDVDDHPDHSPPAIVGASNAPVVHCSPWIRWVESRADREASSVMASARSGMKSCAEVGLGPVEAP
jgi:hypothetical protein